MKQISANFGVVKDTIYNFSAKEMIAESNKQNTTLHKFFKLIQENSILKIQYLIYKNIENGSASSERLAERFINQNLKLIENFKWEDIIRTNKTTKLQLVDKYESEPAPNKEELYESIHTLIKSVTKNEFNDINKSQTAFDYLMEHLLKEKNVEATTVETTDESEHPKFLSWQFISQHAANKFNETYAHLNENEKNLVKILLSNPTNKNNFYLDLKNENLSKIEGLLSENLLDESAKTAMNKFKNKILSINESELSDAELDDAIINLSELKYTIEDMENTKEVN